MSSPEPTPLRAEPQQQTGADAPEDAAPAPVPTAVRARGLTLTGSRGPVYGPVDLDLPAGTLTVVQGPQGAGRSSLLLTLAGRMVPDAGSDLTVLGEPLPRRRSAVQRRAAVAGFSGIDELDDGVTVADVTRERLAWLSPWYRRTGRVDQGRFAALAEPAFGERPLPRVSTVIWDLDEVDVMLLRVTLALAQQPDLLVVDDLDQVHDSRRRQTVWTRLEALAAAGTTVIASVASLDEVARMRWWTPPQHVNLATGPHAVPAD
ncbi:ATP-binding cassette domain-containing protein [Cellulomonas endometrii]|uniref:ATP-binding cassette domain-containing protein n=1 Tax=Cellulomonas endometrii TaxID=3036301 RepID=UPI0024AD86A7|nr:ATP-binding cassette domain-containing protein [Cellulomonas endometrii]